MVEANDRPRARAVENLHMVLGEGRRFPENVFRGSWQSFRFFDSDWLFQVEVVDSVQALLKALDGSCAALAHLDSTADGQAGLFLIDRGTIREEFRPILTGPRIGEGWLGTLDRFGCAPDGGEWAIYCERAVEIAAIAFRSDKDRQRCATVLARLRAEPIMEAIADPLSYGFSPGILPSPWRDRLLQEYQDLGMPGSPT